MTVGAGAAKQAVGWLALLVGVMVLVVGIALRETGMMGQIFLGLGAYGILNGVLFLAEAWWMGRKGPM
jgi:hypothetical protein